MTLNQILNNIIADMKDVEQRTVEGFTRTQAVRIVESYKDNYLTIADDSVAETATSGDLSFFDQVIQERTDAIHNTLRMKAKEYASTTDRFHNFRAAARREGIAPEKALYGMMLKHEVSVQDMVNNPFNISEKMINEKVGDNINYLILLEGLLKERLQS